MIWLAVIAVLGVIGVVISGSGLQRMRKFQVVSGTGRTLGGGLLAGTAAVGGLVGFNLQTYERLTAEQIAAEISFRAIEDDQFEASMILSPDKPERRAEVSHILEGDRFLLGARVISFNRIATVSGVDAVYRLEFIQGDYEDVDVQNERTPLRYAIHEEAGIDIWDFARRHINAVDTRSGKATYAPMVDGAAYTITVSNTATVDADPANEAARQALERWR